DRLAAILNSTADGILMTDMNGIVLTANPMAAQLFGASEHELLGRSLDELLRGLHERAQEVTLRARAGESTTGAAAGPVQVSEIELRIPRHRFIRQFAMPVRDAQGEVYG